MYDTVGQMRFLCLSLALMLWYGQVSSQVARCDYNLDSCSCETDKGTISLKALGDIKEAYDIQYGVQTFYWNPCKDFTKGTVTAAGIQEQSRGFYYDIGVFKNSNTMVVNGVPIFYMHAGDYFRAMYVKCICETGFSLSFDGESPLTEYQFTLKSDYCCPGAAPAGRTSEGISPGTVMLIIFLVLLFIYVAGGMTYLRAVRNARGKDLIPNLALWAVLPGLIKDGILFTVSGGKRKTYDQI